MNLHSRDLKPNFKDKLILYPKIIWNKSTVCSKRWVGWRGGTKELSKEWKNSSWHLRNCNKHKNKAMIWVKLYPSDPSNLHPGKTGRRQLIKRMTNIVRESWPTLCHNKTYSLSPQKISNLHQFISKVFTREIRLSTNLISVKKTISSMEVSNSILRNLVCLKTQLKKRNSRLTRT